jgi:hypothetical protein
MCMVEHGTWWYLNADFLRLMEILGKLIFVDRSMSLPQTFHSAAFVSVNGPIILHILNSRDSYTSLFVAIMRYAQCLYTTIA